MTNIRRGDIYLADLSPVTGSEQGGLRPVLVFQNNVGNKYSPTVKVAIITSQIQKAKLPTHVIITADKYKIDRDSVIMCEQTRTVDKERLDYENKIAVLDFEDMLKVDIALLISDGLLDIFKSEAKVNYIKNMIAEGKIK